MERERILADLHGQIENLTRLHIQYRLQETEHFQKHKAAIEQTVAANKIDVRSELDPVAQMLYRRYFG